MMLTNWQFCILAFFWMRKTFVDLALYDAFQLSFYTVVHLAGLSKSEKENTGTGLFHHHHEFKLQIGKLHLDEENLE